MERVAGQDLLPGYQPWSWGRPSRAPGHSLCCLTGPGLAVGSTAPWRSVQEGKERRVVAHPFLEHDGPLAIAHRGGALDGRENSMAAFARAVETACASYDEDPLAFSKAGRVASERVLSEYAPERLDGDLLAFFEPLTGRRGYQR